MNQNHEKITATWDQYGRLNIQGLPTLGTGVSTKKASDLSGLIIQCINIKTTVNTKNRDAASKLKTQQANHQHLTKCQSIRIIQESETSKILGFETTTSKN